MLDEVAAYLDAGRDAPPHPDPARSPSGFYVHGPAGRGKTWLLSELFAAAPISAAAKRRVHFHAFFQQLQRRFGAMLSARDAIDETVAALLDGAGLFFFDELHVHDPGGAALLNRLLDELSRRGVPTLATSNSAPEQLLPNPVYHHVFEPGIRIIRERFAVRSLDGGTDYRIDAIAPTGRFAAGRWIVSERGSDTAALDAGLTPPSRAEAATVLEGHRALRASAVRGREVWFGFTELLEAPSIAQDYLELSERFDSWVLTGVPALSQASSAARHRFIALLDVLVDHDHSLTVIAEVDRRRLVDISDPPVDFFRAESRLALLRAS